MNLHILFLFPGTGYQVVQMNTAYVTSVNPSDERTSPPRLQTLSGSGLIYDGEHSPELAGSSGRRSDTPVPVCHTMSGAVGYIGMNCQ